MSKNLSTWVMDYPLQLTYEIVAHTHGYALCLGLLGGPYPWGFPNSHIIQVCVLISDILYVCEFENLVHFKCEK